MVSACLTALMCPERKARTSQRVIQLASVNHDSIRAPRFSLDKIETLR